MENQTFAVKCSSGFLRFRNVYIISFDFMRIKLHQLDDEIIYFTPLVMEKYDLIEPHGTNN